MLHLLVSNIQIQLDMPELIPSVLLVVKVEISLRTTKMLDSVMPLVVMARRSQVHQSHMLRKHLLNTN